VWYRDALAEYVRNILLDARSLSRTYVQRSRVEAMVAGHLKGDNNHTNNIHLLLTLELIHRRFIDQR
jgi:asparagine synthase (glutamine-hydrolysing)